MEKTGEIATGRNSKPETVATDRIDLNRGDRWTAIGSVVLHKSLVILILDIMQLKRYWVQLFLLGRTNSCTIPAFVRINQMETYLLDPKKLL